MQPGGEDLPVNHGVQMVRRTVMHHLQPGMGQQRFHAVVGMGNVQRVCFVLRRFKAAVAQRHDLNIPRRRSASRCAGPINPAPIIAT